MSLTAALNTARSSLSATSAQISVSSRNVSGASDPSYSRKIATTITNADGSARIAQVSRATDNALYFTMLSATSKAAGQEAIANGLDMLSATVGDPQSDQSPAGRLSALTTALQQFANEPDSQALAESVLMEASELATTVNNAAQKVSDVRRTADQDIAASVTNINELLTRFEKLNDQAVQGPSPVTTSPTCSTSATQSFPPSPRRWACRSSRAPTTTW